MANSKYKKHPRDPQLMDAVQNLNYKKVLQLLTKDPVDEPTLEVRVNSLRLILLVFTNATDDVEVQHLVIKILKLLLDTKADVNITDCASRTAMHLALANRMSIVVDFLLSRKASLRVCDRYRNNLLHHLIQSDFLRFQHYGNLENTTEKEKFIKRSADFIEWFIYKNPGLVNFTNKREETPLHLAAKFNLLHAIPILLKYTTYVQIFDCLGMTAFQVFIEAAVCEKDQAGCFRLTVNNFYEPAYIESICQMFLKKRFSVDVPDIRNTPLHYALMDQKRNIAKLMLPYLNNVNARNCIGDTALNIIMHYDHHEKIDEEIVRVLLDKEADVHKLNNQCISPIIIAVEKRKLKMLKMFKQYGAKFSCLFRTGNLLHYFLKSQTPTDEETYISIFNLLTNEGCDVNTKDIWGSTPLHLACKNGKIEIVKGLIHLGADVNSRDSFCELTPLHEAVESHNPNLLKLLVRNGADINATNYQGQTALHFCLEDSTKKLVELGACIHIMDTNGCLPLQTAIEKKNKLAFEALLRYGADINDGANFHSLDHLLSFPNVTIHLTKLMAADLPMARMLKKCITESEYKSEQIYKNCKKEIRSLKKYKISNGTSLYDLLHLNRNSMYRHINNVKLQELMSSSDFVKRFPNYNVLISSIYYQAIGRNKLLRPARDAWLELTDIRLPTVCIYEILSNLSNFDLKIMVGRTNHR